MDKVRHQCCPVQHNRLTNRSGRVTVNPPQVLESEQDTGLCGESMWSVYRVRERCAKAQWNQVSSKMHYVKTDSRENMLVSLVWFLISSLVRFKWEQTSTCRFKSDHIYLSSLHSQPWTEQACSEESDLQQQLHARGSFAHARMHTCGDLLFTPDQLEWRSWGLDACWKAQRQRELKGRSGWSCFSHLETLKTICA